MGKESTFLERIVFGTPESSLLSAIGLQAEKEVGELLMEYMQDTQMQKGSRIIIGFFQAVDKEHGSLADVYRIGKMDAISAPTLQRMGYSEVSA